jgi:hypothetical protein
VASCSSVIGTSTGGCTWSGAPAAPGGRPCRALVCLWPSWRCWPTRPRQRHQRPNRRGWAPRGVAQVAAGPPSTGYGDAAVPWAGPRGQRTADIGQSGFWAKTRQVAGARPGYGVRRPRHVRDWAQPHLVDAGSTCAGPCRVSRLLPDWEVDGGSALPDLTLTRMRWPSDPQCAEGAHPTTARDAVSPSSSWPAS